MGTMPVSYVVLALGILYAIVLIAIWYNRFEHVTYTTVTRYVDATKPATDAPMETERSAGEFKMQRRGNTVRHADLPSSPLDGWRVVDVPPDRIASESVIEARTNGGDR